MVALDFSILNVALPTLGRDLGLGQASLQWGVTAFALPSAGFLLLAGRTSDVIGRRRMFLAGPALFTAASVLATFLRGKRRNAQRAAPTGPVSVAMSAVPSRQASTPTTEGAA